MPPATASARMKSWIHGLKERLTTGAPNGANGTMKLLNSPPQSYIRARPVPAMRTSRPAPP